MKQVKKILIGVISIALISVSVVYAGGFNPRKSVEFFKGHTHDAEGTHGATSHSGGTDRYGCHNGSVPYHCH